MKLGQLKKIPAGDPVVGSMWGTTAAEFATPIGAGGKGAAAAVPIL